MSHHNSPILPEISECGSSKCCIEAVLSIDSRGQLVIPKDVRERAGIADGDKLALLGWERGGIICCLSLIRVEEFSPNVSKMLASITK